MTLNLSEAKNHDCQHHPRGSVRRASGFVLTGYPEVIAPEQTFNDAGQKSSSRKFATTDSGRFGESWKTASHEHRVALLIQVLQFARLSRRHTRTLYASLRVSRS